MEHVLGFSICSIFTFEMLFCSYSSRVVHVYIGLFTEATSPCLICTRLQLAIQAVLLEHCNGHRITTEGLSKLQQNSNAICKQSQGRKLCLRIHTFFNSLNLLPPCYIELVGSGSGLEWGKDIFSLMVCMLPALNLPSRDGKKNLKFLCALSGYTFFKGSLSLDSFIIAALEKTFSHIGYIGSSCLMLLI